MPRHDGYDLEKTQAPERPYNPREGRGAHIAEKMMYEERMQAQAMQSGIGGAANMAADPLDDLFRYHPPSLEDLPKYAAINQAAKNFAAIVMQNCPIGEDFRVAINCIRNARMFANAAISLKGRTF